MQTIQEFIQTTGLRMTVEPRNSNPNMAADDKWHAGANHWTCTIHLGRQGMAVAFSQGSAHTSPPTLDSVLDCLASDASGADETFEGFCSNFGYDIDSRKALKTYNTIKRQSARLCKLLGTKAYADLVMETERL
jgi:hypothetical protein